MAFIIIYAVVITTLLFIALCGDSNLVQRNRDLRRANANLHRSNAFLTSNLAYYISRTTADADLLPFPTRDERTGGLG